MYSIRRKILTVTIAAILTSILFLGGIGVVTVGVEGERSAVERMTLISENAQRQVDAYLQSIQQSVDMAIFVAHDSLEKLDISLLGGMRTPEDMDRLDKLLRAHSGEVEHAFRTIANSTSGVVTYYYCINADLGSTEHGFFWSSVDEETFVKQPPLISTELDINDSEHTAWYYSPLKAGRPVWVGPYKAHFLGELWTVSYVAPIYARGFLIGVLGMDILFDTIIDQVSPIRVYDTGFASLLDRDGRILYHPSLPIGSTPEMEGLDPELLKLSRSGDEAIRYTVGGEKRQLAFSTLINKMKVVVTAPVSEISASRRQLTSMVLALAAVIIAVFAVIMVLIVNAITTPLERLTAASKRLAAGDYDAELDYEGKDEVGTLTASFRQMRDDLKLFIGDLNSRVNTDAMTGVKNKGAFNISLGRLNDAIRLTGEGDRESFAILIFDCNNLKQINDSFGHEHGDLYLKTACRLICRVFSSCPVFRLGGDEFGVILQNAAYLERDELLRRFESMAEAQSAAAAEPWEKIDISKGMAAFDPDSDQTAEQVFNRADERMYEDKKHHKLSHV